MVYILPYTTIVTCHSPHFVFQLNPNQALMGPRPCILPVQRQRLQPPYNFNTLGSQPLLWRVGKPILRGTYLLGMGLQGVGFTKKCFTSCHVIFYMVDISKSLLTLYKYFIDGKEYLICITPGKSVINT